MSITFDCQYCGKSFTIDDKFAGKKGRCKGCGEVMEIPGQARAIKAPVASQTARRTNPGPVVPAPPIDDVYGFDDTPLPPRSSAPRNDEDDFAPPIRPVAKKKKKARGFFSSSGGSKSSGSSFDFSSGLVRVGGGLLMTLVVLPMIYGAINGWTPRSEIENYYRNQITMIDEFASLLRTVNDVPSASRQSAIVNQKLRAITRYTRENMSRKGKLSDIDSLTAKYKPEQDRANNAVINEINRLQQIPGAVQALNIEAAIQEAATLEREQEQLRQQNRNAQ